MVDEKEKSTCSGCGACAAACPKQCITMEADERGFPYPRIDRDACVACRACDAVCESAAEKPAKDTVPRAFGLRAKDRSLLLQSSSGGVFSLLAERVLEKGGIICGAAMTEDLRGVRHVFAESREELDALRGSKYVQSRTDGIYPRIRDALEGGRAVLFSGAPCQVDGLKAYLGREDEALFCVDFFCHGVPSPLVWEKTCGELEKKHGGRITDVRFRDKKSGWAASELCFTLNGKRELRRDKKTDPYLRLFLGNYSLRPSCFACAHKGLARRSDVTLADFWGVRQLAPELYSGDGVSLALAHSEKGAQLLEGLDAVAQPVDAREAAGRNKAGLNSVVKPPQYEEFWAALRTSGIEKLADRFVPVDPKTKLKSWVRRSPVGSLLKKGR